jgi:putative mRNA 3-end processing factor
MGNGIEVEVDGVKIHLDPRRAEGVSFVSHAHADHRPSSLSGRVITSRETRFLSSLESEAYDYCSEIRVDGIGLRILESGHILGAGQLLIENDFRVVYTGDLSLEGGATTGGAKVERCDILIIEATYGSPYYRFPKREEVVGEIKDWIEGCFSKGDKACLLAYSMGKAQELTRYLSGEFRVEVHPSIYENNKKYEGLGKMLGRYSLYDGGDEDAVLLIPPGARKGKKYEGYPKAIASGWAVHEGAKRIYGVEEAFPLSDHSDFHGLVRYVERAEPQVVYTTHGFAEEFSGELRERGFYSEPVRRKDQTKIEEFA